MVYFVWIFSEHWYFIEILKKGYKIVSKQMIFIWNFTYYKKDCFLCENKKIEYDEKNFMLWSNQKLPCIHDKFVKFDNNFFI